MSLTSEKSFAEVWSAAQRSRGVYLRVLVWRAWRTSRTWLRRRLGAIRPRTRAARVQRGASSPGPASSRSARIPALT